jgi:uncharacterized protein involved in exopolysaccharide biosynthesis
MSARSVLRYWWLVLLATVAAVGGAIGVTSTTVPLYEARGTYVIGPSDSLEEPEAIVRSFDSLQGQGIVPTLVELLSSETIAANVGRRIGLDPAALERYEVRANVLSSSNTLELTVVGPDAEQTRAMAEGIGTASSTLFEGLYSVYQIVPLDVPEVPQDPVSPDPARNLVVGAMLGLTGGVGLALLAARVRNHSGAGAGRARSAPARQRRRSGAVREDPVSPSPDEEPVRREPAGATGHWSTLE